MKLLVPFFVMTLLLGSETFAAETAVCKIVQSEHAPFKNFVGGTLTIDLTTGNNRLAKTDENGNTLQYISVSNSKVSSFDVDRKACKFTAKKEQDQNGNLKSASFDFDCTYEDPEVPGYQVYVSVIQSFNLETNRGVYQELIQDVDGTRAPNFHFSDCSIQ